MNVIEYINQNFWYNYNRCKSYAYVFYYTYIHNFNKNVIKM